MGRARGPYLGASRSAQFIVSTSQSADVVPGNPHGTAAGATALSVFLLHASSLRIEEPSAASDYRPRSRKRKSTNSSRSTPPGTMCARDGQRTAGGSRIGPALSTVSLVALPRFALRPAYATEIPTRKMFGIGVGANMVIIFLCSKSLFLFFGGRVLISLDSDR
jgi:hypothetical protein